MTGTGAYLVSTADEFPKVRIFAKPVFYRKCFFFAKMVFWMRRIVKHTELSVKLVFLNVLAIIEVVLCPETLYISTILVSFMFLRISTLSNCFYLHISFVFCQNHINTNPI